MTAFVKTPHLWIQKSLTKADSLKSAIDPGRSRGKPVGSHMDDLIALRKIILLCSGCEKSFIREYWKHDYRKEKLLCGGKCDSCRTESENNRGYIPGENWSVAHGGDESKARKGRWGLSPEHVVSRMRLPSVLTMRKTLFGKG